MLEYLSMACKKIKQSAIFSLSSSFILVNSKKIGRLTMKTYRIIRVLEREAVTKLDKENVLGVGVEKVVEAVAKGEPAGLVITRPALRPDEVEDRAGPIFPADDQVRAELEEIEVGIGERIVGQAVRVFVNVVCRAGGIGHELSGLENVIPVFKPLRARIHDPLEFCVLARRDKGYAAILDRELGRQAPIEADSEPDRLLVEGSHDVAGLVPERASSDPLEQRFIDLELGSQGEGQGV